MPRIGMFCQKNILSDNRNEPVLAGISLLCGELYALPLPRGENPPLFDVLIINDPHESAGQVLADMLPDSFVLMNSDRSKTMPIRRYSGNLITYGLNQKACITTSSIVDDELGGQLQICIQRGFPTAAGEPAAVQEFPVHMHALGVDAAIALVGAMLVCGAKVWEIDEVFNFAKQA
ncbi:MAG: hypothetical protein FWE20_01355 [Defluviitaleaceae bacterium]|nr:hypothetical protein [Defluviitaleaceae bacterium]